MKKRVWSVQNAQIVRGDAAAMPFRPAAFELVVSNLGLNNFDDASAAVAECARVLRADGTLAITTNLQGHMQEFYDVFAATLREFDLAEAEKALQSHVEHRATEESVAALFNAAGLRVTRVDKRTLPMRFANGSALLRHYFIKVGFLGAWKDIVPDADRERVFQRLESNLNALAEREGELRLTIPLAYIEATRA